MPRANAAPALAEGDEEPEVPAALQRGLHDILRLLADMSQSRDDDRAAAEAAAEAAVAAALLERTCVDALFAALNLAPPAVPPRPFTPPARPPPAIPGGLLPYRRRPFRRLRQPRWCRHLRPLLLGSLRRLQ